jgi:hypothetical protein
MADESKRPIIVDVGGATDEQLDGLAEVIADALLRRREQALAAKRREERPGSG